MREIRLYGSEGGEAKNLSYPYQERDTGCPIIDPSIRRGEMYFVFFLRENKEGVISPLIKEVLCRLNLCCRIWEKGLQKAK